MEINRMELKWSAHNRHLLLPQMHENSFKNNKTVNPETGCHTAIVNGRSFKVSASGADRRAKKQHNWFNSKDVLLKDAIMNNDAAEVTTLTTAEFVNATANLKRDTPLTVAAENGKSEAARALIALGADVNKTLKDMAGSTPLMVAAKKNRASTITVLLEGMAAVDKVDKQGCTALHHAVQSDHVEAAEALLVGGADVNIRDHTYSTPLIHACKQLAKMEGNVVPVLLKYGARVNDQDGYEADSKSGQALGGGKTALHYAAQHDRFEVVKALIDAGADVTLRDDNTFDEESGTGDLPLRASDYSKRGTSTRTLLKEKEAGLKKEQEVVSTESNDTLASVGPN